MCGSIVHGCWRIFINKNAHKSKCAMLLEMYVNDAKTKNVAFIFIIFKNILTVSFTCEQGAWWVRVTRWIMCVKNESSSLQRLWNTTLLRTDDHKYGYLWQHKDTHTHTNTHTHTHTADRKLTGCCLTVWIWTLW